MWFFSCPIISLSAIYLRYAYNASHTFVYIWIELPALPGCALAIITARARWHTKVFNLVSQRPGNHASRLWGFFLSAREFNGSPLIKRRNERAFCLAVLICFVWLNPHKCKWALARNESEIWHPRSKSSLTNTLTKHQDFPQNVLYLTQWCL